MGQERTPTTPILTERNAFPVGKSIIAGILSLIAIRYLLSLVPFPYPIDRQHMEFYYHGIMHNIPTQDGYCYTGQSDVLENISQMADLMLRPEKKMNFVSFRSFQECEKTYSDPKTVFGYERFLSPRYYWPNKMNDSSPHKIGFVGMGAELIPSSQKNIKYWINSTQLKESLSAKSHGARLLPYFPQYSSYDESFRVSEEKIQENYSGYCSVAVGNFLKLKKKFTMKFQDRWNGKRNNFDEEVYGDNITISEEGIKLSLYVTNNSGRSIYYGLAEEISFNQEQTLDFSKILDWGRENCRNASIAAQKIQANSGSKWLFGFNSANN